MTSSEKPDKFRIKGILNWILLALAVLQGSAQLLGFLMQGSTSTEPSLWSMWISLGAEITKNWSAFSIFLIFFVLGWLLYNQLFDEKKDDIARQKQSMMQSIWFLIINLILCNQVYSSTSVTEKITYFKEHLPNVIVIINIIILCMVGIWTIWNEHKVSDELDKILRSESSDEDGQNDISEQENKYIWKHPISYAWHMQNYYIATQRKIKNENKNKKIQSKAELHFQKQKQKLESLERKFEFEQKINEIHQNEELKDIKNGISRKSKLKNEIKDLKTKLGEYIAGAVTTILAFWFTILIFIIYPQFNNQTSNGILNFIANIIDNLLLINQQSIKQQTPLTNSLLNMGYIFLIFLALFTIYLLAYITGRLIIYFLFNFREDEEHIKNLAHQIKTFVFSLIEGIILPLLFFPNFVKFIEEFLLNFEIKNTVEKWYPPKNKNNTLSQDDIFSSTGEGEKEKDHESKETPPKNKNDAPSQDDIVSPTGEGEEEEEHESKETTEKKSLHV